MTTADRVSRSETWRQEFIRSCGAKCHYCNRPGTLERGPDDRPWHIDHKNALATGGEDAEGNLALACKRCNLTKGTRPYKSFVTFARAAFWQPESDWRVSEFHLDELMRRYELAPGSDNEYGRWRVDLDELRIWMLPDQDEGPSAAEFVLTTKPEEPHWDPKRATGDAQCTLALVEMMHAKLPALIAEIRMLRAELAEAKE